MQKCCWSAAGAVWKAASAAGVGETDGEGLVWCSGSRIEGDRLVAGRLAGGGDPPFPLVGVLRFLVGVEQQVTAARAAPTLLLEEPQPGPVQRGSPAASPGRPVAGQGWVVW